MGTKNRKTDREEERHESLTGVTPRLEDLKLRTVLTSRKVKGRSHTGTVVAEAGIKMLMVAGKAYRSLSAAGSSITGLACRGGVFWQLLPAPRYAPATPGPKRPAKKAAKKTGARKSRSNKTAQPAAKQTAAKS